jgi:hypothetical protein
MTSIFGYRSAKRRFIAGFILGWSALANASNWARVMTVLQADFGWADPAAAFAAGASQIPCTVMTAASGATVVPLSLLELRAAEAAEGAFELGFAAEGELACPTAMEQSSRAARLRMRMG